MKRKISPMSKELKKNGEGGGKRPRKGQKLGKRVKREWREKKGSAERILQEKRNGITPRRSGKNGVCKEGERLDYRKERSQ